ncbi:pirin family protein [bacterium]|nr:pirin family protein [bacterium]
MIQVHPAGNRGHLDHGWLDTRHTFSFGQFHDPARMGFRALRVINEDIIAPGMGFGKHPHRDMEILTYVLAGGLAHTDSMNNTSVIGPGRVQRMSAGTGVVHAEHNASDTEPVHLLQIWLLPDAAGHPPSYEELDLGPGDIDGRLRVLASPDADDGATTWHQDAWLYACRLPAAGEIGHVLAPDRHAWLQVARGTAQLGGVGLEAGDGAAVSGESRLDITSIEGTEFLLFDLA